MVRFMIVALVLAAPASAAGQERIKSARIPVEREAFIASDNRNYDGGGVFDALGSVTFSAADKRIEFTGLQRVSLPSPGTPPIDRFFVRHEYFSLTSIVRTSEDEFAFQGTNSGPFQRTITGKVRIARIQGGPMGTVTEFLMEEHGDSLRGVMNRYVLARSPAANAMREKYKDIDFGGNWAELEPGR